MNKSLHDAWWRLVSRPPRSLSDRLSLGFLDAAAALYGAGVSARNAAYDRGCLRSVRLDRPVISVGNLSMGGTGKTACVEYLAQKLGRHGTRVSVLSRGYHGRTGTTPYTLCVRKGRLTVDGQADGPGGLPADLPDEPQLLAWHLPDVPIVVGRRRDLSGAVAIERWQAEVLLLDDGLQHRRLARSLEIVLVSAQMPLGGWPLLPRGPMREPLASLRRADVIMITKSDQSLEQLAAVQERLAARHPGAAIVTARHEPCALQDVIGGEAVPLDRLNGVSVALLSGLGDPQGFEFTVQQLGATIASHAIYPDHHRYTPDEWRGIRASAKAAGAAAVVTTEKDWMRLRPIVAGAPDVATWVLPVRFRVVSGEEVLDARLAAVCAR